MILQKYTIFLIYCRYKDDIEKQSMKIKYLKIKNWLVVTLMGAFGLSSCHCQKEVTKQQQPTRDNEPPAVQDREEMRLMYGVPTMNFMVRGQVKDADGRPVKDIRLNILERGMEVKDGQLQGDPGKVAEWLDYSAVATDSEGRFVLKSSGIPQEQVRVLVRDVDGAENGVYAVSDVAFSGVSNLTASAAGVYRYGLSADQFANKNGSFKDQCLEIPVRQSDVDLEGAGGWNQGTFNKEVNVLLEKR